MIVIYSILFGRETTHTSSAFWILGGKRLFVAEVDSDNLMLSTDSRVTT